MILHLPLPIWQQMHEYVLASLPNEVTGIGVIQILNPHEVTVTQLFLPQQHVNESFSEFAKGELGRIISKFVGNNPACAGNLCFRWHSHADGRVFWSAIDEQDIERWKGDHVFNLVTNAKGDCLIRLDCFKPFRIKFLDVQLQIDYPTLDPVFRQHYHDEVAAKVHPIPPEPKGFKQIDSEDFDLLKLFHQGGLSHEDY